MPGIFESQPWVMVLLVIAIVECWTATKAAARALMRRREARTALDHAPAPRAAPLP